MEQFEIENVECLSSSDNVRARKRGSVSVPCPKCDFNTRVLQTRRHDGEVWRERVCRNKKGHRFWTREAVAPDA